MAKKNKSIEIESFYNHPIEQVWQALTDKRALSQWLMETDFEPTVGHKFRFTDKPVTGWRGYVECEVLEIEAPHHLKISWQGMPDHSVTYVTWTLTEENGGTRLRFYHEGFDGTMGLFNGFMLRQIFKGGAKRMYGDYLPAVLTHMDAHGLDTPLEAGAIKRQCK